MANTNQVANDAVADGKARVPPYTSFRTLLTFLKDQRENGVPSQIDRSVLTSFSGSVGSQILSALKFLKLIRADGTVLPALNELVEAYETDVWAHTLRVIIEEAYAPILAEDLERMTPAQFRELFKSHYSAKDAVLQKCEVFFLHAASAAGIQVNPRVVKHRSTRSTGSTKRQSEKQKPDTDDRKGDAAKRKASTPKEEAETSQSVYEILIGILDMDEMEPDEQDAVWTLIRYVKRREAGL